MLVLLHRMIHKIIHKVIRRTIHKSGHTCSTLDKLKETKQNKTKIEKEKNKRKTFEDVFDEKIVSDILKITLKDFIDMRKTIKKPMTSRALELLIDKVRKMTTDEQEQIDILNQSIEHGWQTVYPIKQDCKSNSTQDFSKLEDF